jgi:hypothetical protein
MVAEHPILRTSFHWDGLSEPLQCPASAILPVACDDWRQLCRQEQDAAVGAWIEGEKLRPFDLGRRRWHASTFIAAARGVSAGFLLSPRNPGWLELRHLFHTPNQLLFEDHAGPGACTGASKRHYRDFIALERHAIESEASRQFWTERLADLEVDRLSRPSSVKRDASRSLVSMPWISPRRSPTVSSVSRGEQACRSRPCSSRLTFAWWDY